MTNAKLPTTCFADKTDNSDVLTIIKKVDPFNTSLSIPCLGITFPSLKQLLAMLVGIVGKIAGQLKAILIAAIQNAIFMLCQKYGVFKVLSLLNSAALAIKEVANLLGALNNIHICGINLFNQKTFDAINGVMAETIYGINTITHIVPIATGAISVGVNNVFDNIVTEPLASVATGSTPVPPSISLAAPSAYIQQYSAVDLYPGYKTFVDPYGQGNPVYTARNGEPNYISAEQHTFFVAQKSFVSGLESSIINNTLSSTGLYSLFGSVTSITQAFAATRILGVGFGTALAIGAGAIAVTSLVHNIPQVYNPQPSLLPSNSLVNQSMTDFTTKRFALNNIATQARIGVGAYS
jgi:hypothetical protein